MQFRRRRNRSTPASSDTGMLLNLALFIMLLAFFIVLNSLSSYEERLVSPVVDSLEQTFDKSAQKQDVAPSISPDPVNSVNEGDTFERLDALFSTQIVSYKKTIPSNRGYMMLELPLEKFSRAIMAAGQKDLTKMSALRDPRGNFMIPTLVSIIKSDKKGVTYRMNILLQLPDNPSKFQNSNPTEMSAMMKRASALASKLERGGFEQKLINIGLQKGDPKMVKLVFTPHAPFSPVNPDQALKDRIEGGRE